MQEFPVVLETYHSKDPNTNAIAPTTPPPAAFLTAEFPVDVEDAAEAVDVPVAAIAAVSALEEEAEVGFALLRAPPVVCTVPDSVVRPPSTPGLGDGVATVVSLVTTTLVVAGADGVVVDTGLVLKPVRKLGEYVPVPV